MPGDYFTGAHARYVMEREKREGGGGGRGGGDSSAQSSIAQVKVK